MAEESVNRVKDWSPSEKGVAHATKALGRPLRDAREESGLSQAQVAEQAGISQQLLSRLESGEAKFEYKVLYALAQVYGVKGSELLPQNSYPSAPLDHEERLAWVRARNRAIAAGEPAKARERAGRLREKGLI